MHKVIEPKALYFGTPVVLISSLNEDNTTNIAPMSSAWWLGQSCMLGMSKRSRTVENLQRYPECVLNLPDPSLVQNVNKLALLTGKNPVPEYKMKMGYTFEHNKFEVAGFSSLQSDIVTPLRIRECPVNLEGKVTKIETFTEDEPHIVSIVIKIVKIHIEEELIVPGTRNYVDTDKWSPLIMNFCEYYGLSGKLQKSMLAEAWEPILNS